MKKYGFIFGVMSLFILITLFFVVTLNSVDIINHQVFTILKIMIILFSMFIGGYIAGNKSKEKGWFEGLKISVTYVLFFFIINIFIFKSAFTFKTVFYYLILVSTCIFGSIIGINKKE